MINNILKKCLEELSKESPKLDYVRGMLETVIEMTEVKEPQMQSYSWKIPATTTTASLSQEKNPGVQEVAVTDQGQLLDAQAKVNLEKIKALAAKSVETS